MMPPENERSFSGRPSVMRRIEAEMQRRAAAGVLAPRLHEEAQFLRQWAEKHIDRKIQIPQTRSIENGIRASYRRLRGRPKH